MCAGCVCLCARARVANTKTHTHTHTHTHSQLYRGISFGADFAQLFQGVTEEVHRCLDRVLAEILISECSGMFPVRSRCREYF